MLTKIELLLGDDDSEEQVGKEEEAQEEEGEEEAFEEGHHWAPASQLFLTKPLQFRFLSQLVIV